MKYWYMLQVAELWKHFKWKKPVTKDHILYYSIYMNGKWLLKMYEISFGDD